MIVYTLTNTRTGQVYVGTTRDTPEQRWAQLCQAASDGVEADLYSDIRHCGEAAFELQEWAVAGDLAELRQLTAEALAEYQAINLQGIPTRASRPLGSQWQSDAASAAAPAARSASNAGARAGTAPSRTTAAKGASNKLPTGRSGSSSKEKKIREAIEQERQARQSAERARQQQQSEEMAAIMAKIDSRGKR